MAVQKVAYDGHTLIDLSQDTAVESDVASGKYFHKSNGERVQGTATGGIATFPQTINLTVNISSSAPGHINVYWRQSDEDHPNQVCWGSYEIFYAAGDNTDSATITLCALDPNDVLVDGFYIGPLWDGAYITDVTVVGGTAVYRTAGATGTDTIYIIANSSTVTVTISMPE